MDSRFETRWFYFIRENILSSQVILEVPSSTSEKTKYL